MNRDAVLANPDRLIAEVPLDSCTSLVVRPQEHAAHLEAALAAGHDERAQVEAAADSDPERSTWRRGGARGPVPGSLRGW